MIFIPRTTVYASCILFWALAIVLFAVNAHNLALSRDMASELSGQLQIMLKWYAGWALLSAFILHAASIISGKHWNRWKSVLAHIVLLGTFFIVFLFVTTLSVLLFDGEVGEQSELLPAMWYLLKNNHWPVEGFIYVAFVSVGYVMGYLKRVRAAERQTATLKAQLTQTELDVLKSQLNPHFLFNTLNAISGLVRTDEKNKAIDALAELSHMLRAVLENQKNQMILLDDEIAFIKSYLIIQTMRFNKNLSYTLHIDPGIEKHCIPFMLIYILVENAVQHGAQNDGRPNHVELTITTHGENLVVDLQNVAAQRQKQGGFGIGHNNVRNRLQKLFDGNSEFAFKALADERIQTRLVFPSPPVTA